MRRSPTILNGIVHKGVILLSWCAFLVRQDAFITEEASRDPMTGLLTLARDARTRLLDQIDKYVSKVHAIEVCRAITIVHLLTNTTWGVNVSPIRFLACRQAAPLRSVAPVAGDRSVGSSLLDDVEASRVQVQGRLLEHTELRKAIVVLRDHKFLVEIKSTLHGVVAAVCLLPFGDPEMRTCLISAREGRCLVQISPLVRHLVKCGFRLAIVTEPPPFSRNKSEPDRRFDSVLTEVTAAQHALIDYCVVSLALKESLDESARTAGWLKSECSRNIDRFGVTYVQVQPDASTQTVWLGLVFHSQPENEKTVRLKSAYIDSRSEGVSMSRILFGSERLAN